MMSHGAGAPHVDNRDASGRAALASFAVLELITFPLMLWWGHNISFGVDDWDFLAARKIGNFGDLVRPHFGHWTSLPIIAYRLVWSVFGLRAYAPYLTLVVVAHLAVVALLRVLMRRAGVGPWVATLAAVMVLFFGSGAENVLVAFQVTFVGALAFGLGQLLLADHDGPLSRSDWLGLLCGMAALLCSAVGVTTAAVVGLAVLLRRGWRIAAFHTAPLAVVFVTWTLAAPKGQSISKWQATSPIEVVKFVGVGLEAAFARLGHVPFVGVLLAMVLVAGLAAICASPSRRSLRGALAAPIALLVGAVLFLVLTGAFRAGQTGLLAHAVGTGPARARLSRYVYVVVVLAVPAIAVSVDTIKRARPNLLVPLFALLVVGVPGNIREFTKYADTPTRNVALREYFITASQDPLVPQLSRSLEPQPILAPDVTMGWLVDNLRSGRIPRAHALKPIQIASVEFDLALERSLVAHASSCTELVRPTTRVLRNGHSLAVASGVVNLYLRVAGGLSIPEQLPRGTRVTARAGPLQLLVVVPPKSSPNGAVVCTRS